MTSNGQLFDTLTSVSHERAHPPNDGIRQTELSIRFCQEDAVVNALAYARTEYPSSTAVFQRCHL